MVTFLDALVKALSAAGAYNRDDQEAPLAVLWTDPKRQWEPLLPRLRARLPVLTLGPYAPEAWTGPAVWLRASLARALPAPALEPDTIPIIYLPDVARADLRAIEECASHLQPLAFLQYRGVFWSQRSGRDWTVAAFLQNAQDGLGIAVSTDTATSEALLRALNRIADLPVERLRQEAPLRAAFFDGLFVLDEARDLLAWINDPAAFCAGRTPEAWDAFCAIARQRYAVDPSTATPIDAARLLGERPSERWELVWQQFALTPALFPAIPDRLRQAKPTRQLPLFARNDAWPQENEAAEEQLRAALTALDNVKASEAREAVRQLERAHGVRRTWVWAKLGWAPLAQALEHLTALAAATERVPGGTTLRDVGDAYAAWGWSADAAALQALAMVERQADQAAVASAVCALYRPWLSEAATAFQRAILAEQRLPREAEPVRQAPGTCVIFVDGLRFDLAQRLKTMLDEQAVRVELTWRLGAIPGVTPTAKPAVSPAASRLAGGPGFDTVVQGSTTRVTAEVLRRLITEAGWQVLSGQEHGDPAGCAWTEIGRLDTLGHDFGLALARQADAELRAVTERITGLLEAGWQRVVLVTDHGWLLLPGGLPKAELPEHLTEVRKGRCARLRPNTTVTNPTLPWHWDASVRIAVAPGISSFEANSVYAHGGLSPQECVTPVMTVTPAARDREQVRVATVTWRGLRCTVELSGKVPGLVVDIRLKAGDSATSIADQPKPAGANGIASLVVPDEDHEGMAAQIVVFDEDGAVIAQVGTTVGGE